MLCFLEDLVLGMSLILQRRNVQLGRNIMHDLRVHEGMSVDDGNALALPGPGLNIHQAFQHSVVPPPLPHVVAAGATVAGNRLALS